MRNTSQVGNGIAERLTRLERQNLQLRLGLLLAGAGIVAALLIGTRPAATQPASMRFQVVTARQFVLVDARGKARADLAMTDFDEPEFDLRQAGGGNYFGARVILEPGGWPELDLESPPDAKGAISDSAGLEITPGGGVLQMAHWGRDGDLAANFHLYTSELGPLLALAGQGGKLNVQLGTTLPRLSLSDAASKGEVDLLLPSAGPFGVEQPGLELSDTTGRTRLAIGSTTLTEPAQGGRVITPESSITAYDVNGRVVGRWPQQ